MFSETVGVAVTQEVTFLFPWRKRFQWPCWLGLMSFRFNATSKTLNSHLNCINVFSDFRTVDGCLCSDSSCWVAPDGIKRLQIEE